jgi:uncharacterized protein YbgA (DUF1722 family)
MDELDKETRYRLQILAREQLKMKLLNDIMVDLTICKLENWSFKEYLTELKQLIDSFLTKSK